MTDSTELLGKFRITIGDLSCTEEPDLLNDDNLLRFLKSRNWNLEASEKMFRKTVAWRQSYRPQSIQCEHCRQFPGSHTLRQVGFDELNRPILYVSFYPAYPCQRDMVTEALTHLIYTIENAIRSMGPSVTQWVFIIDCAGMTSTSCNPRIGYECAHIMSSNYPERLGLAICIRPGAVFRAAYGAIKPFLPNTTSGKVVIVNSESQLQTIISSYFSPSMSEWLLDQYRMNRIKPARQRYRQFWMPPTDKQMVDARGEKRYVEEWICENGHPTGHQPHPNMLDYLLGKLDSSVSVDAAEPEDPVEDEDPIAYDDDDERTTEQFLTSLPNEFNIPTKAEPVN